MARWAVLAIALLLPAWVQGQPAEAPNAILLVAKPELADPNFRESVVLVTQAPDASTVGVILNRTTQRRHAKSGKAIGLGGPLAPGALVALFRSPQKPEGQSFHVLKGVHLSMQPTTLEALFAGPAESYRLYSGFSGWAPRQLEAEMRRDSWYILPASESVIFRDDVRGLWRELLEKARKMNAPRAQAPCKKALDILPPCSISPAFS